MTALFSLSIFSYFFLFFEHLRKRCGEEILKRKYNRISSQPRENTEEYSIASFPVPPLYHYHHVISLHHSTMQINILSSSSFLSGLTDDRKAVTCRNTSGLTKRLARRPQRRTDGRTDALQALESLSCTGDFTASWGCSFLALAYTHPPLLPHLQA